jgi:hypothetical protein
MNDVKDHIYVYQPVTQINAPNVLQLIELISGTLDLSFVRGLV